MTEAENMSCLVGGGSGYLGQSVAATLRQIGVNVAVTHCSAPKEDGSIAYRFPGDSLADALSEAVPNTVIFCAEVEKNQPGESCADDPAAFRQAIRQLWSELNDRRIVYVSSDGIYSGKQGQYAESDHPEPQTNYGQNLLIAEEELQNSSDNYAIVRPSYLYGYSQGTLDGRLQAASDALRSGAVLRFFDDMYKSPILVTDAAQIICQVAFSDFCGILHIGGPRVSVADFYRQGMIGLNIAGTIEGENMPIDRGLLRDTSLNTELCQSRFGFLPRRIEHSLRMAD